ncbi:hypothetical protein L1049_021895 [Liquidambar formosana]|uniref:ubiquitinyl hydrolase 1 n=1 Tax=Liquidambar formosana TaxID=63359 RepID=A0AAP0WNH9_LIQFO
MPCVRASEDFCVLCVLRDHIEYSLAHSGEIVSPYELADNLSYISSCFRRFQQEDAHEFLQCLLDRLDSCCLDSKTQDESLPSHGDNFVKQVFGGRLISKLRCCNCGHCSDTYEPLIDLSLEIEDVDNLPSALESFTKVEKIEDPETKFTCENCKEEVLVEKQFMLDQAPLVAAFHLKRFKNDGSYVEKIDKHVEYPLELDLGPYTSGSQDCSVELKYELYAIVVHVGFSSTSGHYFCFIRSSPDTWHKLDDSQVTRVREESVLSQEAYILFYARQGTPWFSSIMEAKKTCLDPDILNTSPKSVLDNVDNICTSSPSVANGYSCGVNETGDAAEGISVQFCSGSRHDGDDVNEAMVGVDAVRDDTQRIIPLMPLGASDSCNETLSNDEDMCTASALKENNCNQETNEVRNNVNIHPQTPPRSLSPDTFSKECPEVQYHIPRDHLRSEKQVACKRPLDKALEDSKRALEDSKRREAVRYVTKQMPVSRGMKLLAAIARSEGSPNKKRNKRKMGLSPCKKASPPCARRRHSHRVVMRPLAAASLR